jgi:cobalt/nickel transport system permease protein
VVALLQNVYAGFASLLCAVICVFFAGIKARPLVKRFVVVNIFIMFLWVTLPFSMDGRTLFSLGRFNFTAEGALYTFIIALKANAIFLFTIAILGTSEIFSLAHALFHLKVPKKLVYLFFFFYRYISVLHREYDRLVSALKIRAFSANTSFHAFKTYAYLVGMLFVNSYERSQRIYQALVLRGFRGDFPLINHFRLRKTDFAFCVITLGMITTFLTIWK